MEISPTEHCEICDDDVPLHQDQANCAYQHNCELIPPNCPLMSLFITKNTARKRRARKTKNKDIPHFYFSDG